MSSTARSQLLRHNLRASLLDGVFFSIMVGTGESYIAAFALAMGLGEAIAGLASSLPQIPGALMQLVSPHAVRALNSHRRWTVLCAAIQGLSFVPLVVAAGWGRLSAAWLFVFMSVYWGSGMATGPSWNAWMTRIFPARIRARYFARRSRFAQLAVLISLIGAGVVLHLGEERALGSLAFVVTFAAAGLARLISARYLAIESEPPLQESDHTLVPFSQGFRRLRHEQGGRLLVYLVSVQAAIYVAGPYFAPFMIKELDFSYATFMLISACSFLAKVIMLPLFGHLAHRFGTAWLMWLGGLGIIFLPALWMVSDSIPYLIFAQLAAGTMWAAHELAALLLMFETIPSKDRTSVLTLFNVGNALGLVAGSLIGAGLLRGFGEGYDAYMIVFAASTVLRVGTLWFLRGVKLRVAHPAPMAVRTLSVQPNAYVMDRPVLPSMPNEAREVT